MIGKAYTALFKFYDNTLQKMSFKKRPVLIIGKADSNDYVILPISRVTNSHNINAEFDLKIEPAVVPLLNLSQISYIRTHKQEIINRAQIDKLIVDFKTEYPDIYISCLEKVEEFQERLLSEAL